MLPDGYGVAYSTWTPKVCNIVASWALLVALAIVLVAGSCLMALLKSKGALGVSPRKDRPHMKVTKN